MGARSITDAPDAGHDMTALAIAAESAAVDCVRHEADYSVKRFDRLIADGVPASSFDMLTVERVRAWLDAR
jgi:hypothetical protein